MSSRYLPTDQKQLTSGSNAHPQLGFWTALPKTETGRFWLSRVIMPLLVTILTLTVGAAIAAWLQYRSHIWSERYDGRRSTQENLQEAAVGLGHELSVLQQEVEVWEITSGNRQLQPLFYPIDRRLELMDGLTLRLQSNYKKDVSRVADALGLCRAEIDELRRCLGDVLLSRLRPRSSAECSKGFEEARCQQVTTETFVIWE